MGQFRFQFDALLRLRRHKRDLCRQLLAQVFASDQELLNRRARVEADRNEVLDQLRGLGGAGQTVDIDRAAARRFHSGQLLVELRLIDRNRDLVAQQIRLCREALIKADQDVRVLEKLQEKQRAEFLYQQERRAARELEEAWLSSRIAERRQ